MTESDAFISTDFGGNVTPSGKVILTERIYASTCLRVIFRRVEALKAEDLYLGFK